MKTEEEIIVDGVDVAGCMFLCKNTAGHICCGDDIREDKIPFANFCQENKDCYYKQLKRSEQELKWANDEEKYLKDCCIKAGKELEKHSFKWDGKEKNLVVQALQLNQLYEKLEQENKELKAYKDVNEDFKKAWDELNKKYTEVLKLAKENADSNEYCLQELEQENKELKSERNEAVIAFNNLILDIISDVPFTGEIGGEKDISIKDHLHQMQKALASLEEIRNIILTYESKEWNCFNDMDVKLEEISKVINEVL